jgi:hypothetical protein
MLCNCVSRARRRPAQTSRRPDNARTAVANFATAPAAKFYACRSPGTPILPPAAKSIRPERPYPEFMVDDAFTWPVPIPDRSRCEGSVRKWSSGRE